MESTKEVYIALETNMMGFIRSCTFISTPYFELEFLPSPEDNSKPNSAKATY